MQEEKIALEELLEEGKSIQIKPMGYSMYPLFVPGRDEVIIAPIEDAVLKRGDAVLYRREGSILVWHRIWKVKNDGCYMVGDNQKEIEGPLDREQIKGIMTGMIRKGKYISVKNPWYRICVGIWLWLRPFRPTLSKIAARLKRRKR